MLTFFKEKKDENVGVMKWDEMIELVIDFEFHCFTEGCSFLYQIQH